MFWINHDAFPKIIEPKLKYALEGIKKKESDLVFTTIRNELECENLGNLFTIEPTIHQTMNYKYLVEIREDSIFLRTQEEYWIEQSEEFDKIPAGYLNSEMRTINIEEID